MRSQFLAEIICRWLHRVSGLLARPVSGLGTSAAAVPCCLSHRGTGALLGWAEQSCSLPWWGSCVLVDAGVAESKVVISDFTQSEGHCHPLWHVQCCQWCPTVLWGLVLLPHISALHVLAEVSSYTSHFFLYHHKVWTTPSQWWDNHKFSFPVMLLKHKVMSHVGCPSPDTLAATSRRTKTGVP